MYVPLKIKRIEMEISKIIYLLEEALSQKADEVDALSRKHQSERSTLSNDIKSLASLVAKHSAPVLAETPTKSDNEQILS